MTTIAWDGYTLAADSQATDGSLKSFYKKILKLEDSILAFDGTLVIGLELVDWYIGNRTFPKHASDAELIVLTPKKLITFEGSDIPLTYPRNKFWAWGSGGHLAIGALAKGADAIEAVKIACKYDTYSGGKIVYYSVND